MSVALSIRQPWAWCILYGGKRVENRTWQTRFRGRFYIHSGLTIDRSALEGVRDVIELQSKEHRPPAVCGALIATANIIDCVRADAAPGGQMEWVTGPWCFVLEDVQPLPQPIPYKGALGFFRVESAPESEKP